MFVFQSNDKKKQNPKFSADPGVAAEQVKKLQEGALNAAHQTAQAPGADTSFTSHATRVKSAAKPKFPANAKTIDMKEQRELQAEFENLRKRSQLQKK
jgi:hypothetical protein